jgi:hypothetical protein
MIGINSAYKDKFNYKSTFLMFKKNCCFLTIDEHGFKGMGFHTSWYHEVVKMRLKLSSYFVGQDVEGEGSFQHPWPPYPLAPFLSISASFLRNWFLFVVLCFVLFGVFAEDEYWRDCRANLIRESSTRNPISYPLSQVLL